MSSKVKKLGNETATLLPKNNFKIGIIVSEYYFDEINKSLLKACYDQLLQANIQDQYIYIEFVPGAFELSSGAQMIYDCYKPDAVIILGCVIKGDTDHDKYINHAVAQGITQLSIATKKPFIFGLLTPNSMKQALDRSGGKHGNKGAEAALACIKMLQLSKKLKVKK